MSAQARIQHFLIVFDHEQGEMVDMREFGEDGDQAVAAYAQAERDYRLRPRVEIVLIGSDSLATVKLTHANYFDRTVTVSRYLVDI